MRPRYRHKGFDGLVRYGQARAAMYARWARNIRGLAALGLLSDREQIEHRAAMQSRAMTRKKAA